VNLDLIIVFLYSYLLGSIPFGLIITKIFLKEDVRNIGSGNIGATNVLRTGKKSLAGFTLLFDVSKGYVSVFLTSIYFSEFIYLAALLCLLGHIFPIWLKFKGGKGVATYLGIIIALSLKFGIVFGASWLVVLFLFKFSSLASIVSSLIVFLYSIIFVDINLNMPLFIFFLIILYAHKDNILRIKNKTENKIKL
jgi:glycerol-3-phosphate acyltransferase PlsY|tara:strand:- start:401 stop:982 length:582 start_codon:yes stop_codon:yes gene_type:complete